MERNLLKYTRYVVRELQETDTGLLLIITQLRPKMKDFAQHTMSPWYHVVKQVLNISMNHIWVPRDERNMDINRFMHYCGILEIIRWRGRKRICVYFIILWTGYGDHKIFYTSNVICHNQCLVAWWAFNSQSSLCGTTAANAEQHLIFVISEQFLYSAEFAGQRMKQLQEQNSGCEPNCHLDSQDIPRLLWNPKGYDNIHQRSSLVTIRSRINPVYIFTNYIFKIHFNIVLYTEKQSEK